MRWELTLVALLLGACGSPALPGAGPDGGSADAGVVDAGDDRNPQEHYTYDACMNPVPVWGCPNAGPYTCALRTITAKYDGCDAGTQCVRADVSDCHGTFSCAPSTVNAAGLAAYRAEIGVEITRYCDGGRCGAISDCIVSFSHRVVGCVAGRCAALPDCDGGRLQQDGGC